MANIVFAKKKEADYQVDKKMQKILIVDDDQSVHDITNMAIKAMQFSDFKLEILAAYSAKEAKEILNEHTDIALALIDVVMETSEAGLNLVNYIRNELKNKLIRLIVRTGQANDYPQMQVIQHFDINDFKEKTELTIERLYTTIRTSIKQYEQLLELQHKYDETYNQMTTNSLTRLPNRIKLIEDFSTLSHQALILIDIIGFSIINETNGYETGDFVLMELGGFLSSMYGNYFRVYHLNSDLFALVATEDLLDDLLLKVEKIKDDISKLQIITNSFNKTIETTIGIAYQSENDVLQKAELALKEARNTGRNQIKVYSADLKIIQQINDTNHWGPIVKHALLHNGLIAYAQPIFNLTNQTIEKYELLVRLKHNGVVYTPAHFLAAARHSGQFYNIFKFMFEEGCRLASKTGKYFSINISDCEFNADGLSTFIEATLKKYALNPSFMSLEILEHNTIGSERGIKEVIKKLSDLGIEFAVDDFGIQCSNFGQIEHLPISTLKIDGSFIQNINESLNSRIVVKTIQTFAKEKRLKLVAEFICNKEVLETVKALGIEYGQGFYLGEPAILDI
ncbi:EAL domain-containing protein [Sulfurimonas sp.]|uniref:two-component system response regulator n=1 Tax=Sulfurimonas sp. TaxID=2022749 RepID=UPI0025D72D1D|nr:EAL domain-containing protein [Sulfurimonas sp.]MDD5158153.1 EAL domain-containing protein [Sulfurimonas sp.]